MTNFETIAFYMIKEQAEYGYGVAQTDIVARWSHFRRLIELVETSPEENTQLLREHLKRGIYDFQTSYLRQAVNAVTFGYADCGKQRYSNYLQELLDTLEGKPEENKKEEPKAEAGPSSEAPDTSAKPAQDPTPAESLALQKAEEKKQEERIKQQREERKSKPKEGESVINWFKRQIQELPANINQKIDELKESKDEDAAVVKANKTLSFNCVVAWGILNINYAQSLSSAEEKTNLLPSMVDKFNNVVLMFPWKRPLTSDHNFLCEQAQDDKRVLLKPFSVTRRLKENPQELLKILNERVNCMLGTTEQGIKVKHGDIDLSSTAYQEVAEELPYNENLVFTFLREFQNYYSALPVFKQQMKKEEEIEAPASSNPSVPESSSATTTTKEAEIRDPAILKIAVQPSRQITPPPPPPPVIPSFEASGIDKVITPAASSSKAVGPVDKKWRRHRGGPYYS